MRLCLASYRGRLAALFENATEFPCYELDPEAEGLPVHVATFSPAHHDPGLRLAALREQDVSTLVCGGICRRLAMQAEAAGLQVVPWICGDNDTVLAACADGSLEQLAMPGCRWVQDDSQPSVPGWGPGCGQGRGQACQSGNQPGNQLGNRQGRRGRNEVNPRGGRRSNATSRNRSGS